VISESGPYLARATEFLERAKTAQEVDAGPEDWKDSGLLTLTRLDSGAQSLEPAFSYSRHIAISRAISVRLPITGAP
jgi:hypothetical protein